MTPTRKQRLVKQRLKEQRVTKRVTERLLRDRTLVPMVIQLDYDEFMTVMRRSLPPSLHELP